MKFFKMHLPTIKSHNDNKNIKKELNIFNFCFNKIYYVSKEVDCSGFIDSKFSPTIPKVIDNAIIGWVRSNEGNSS